MTRFLIIVAVLAAGCEQWKAPQRLHELEDKVDKLSSEVATLKAGSGSAEPGEHAGSAEPGDHAGSGSAEPGEDAAEPAAGSGSAEPAGHGAEPVADAAPPNDAGLTDGGDDKADRALAELHDLIAKSTQRGAKPGQPPPSDSPGAAKPEGPAAPPQWSYEGRTGSPMWGTLDPAWHSCLDGKAQSPIDIEPRAGKATPIVFHYAPTAATVIDNGHTLEVRLAPGSTIEIGKAVYQLVQFHFHTPSEHTVAGERYPLELHLVHQDAAGVLAVIGVLYDAGAESRPLSAVWSKWPRKVGGEDKLKKPFDPSELLPETRTVFRYPGSLTTPPCSEGVVWNVMRRAMTDSKAHLEAFTKHYPHNAREQQALNDRKIE
ncbi:MAG TPA: carbonic anhydrase family protein [Kofleriaceae bacterium]|nr:carbonic anhydrase family protein [Kofleriaceae bacterium]